MARDGRLDGYDLFIASEANVSPEPDFISVTRPPVVEVALAVQFEPNTVNALQAAQLRSKITDKFPEYEQQVARPPLMEDFSPAASRPPVSFEFITTQPMQRFWFLSRDGSQLVQLQHDLLAANWRRLPGGTDYPKYRGLRAILSETLELLDGILAGEGEQPIKPNWCEVTYINHIEPLTTEGPRPPLHQVLRWFASPDEGGFLPPPEDAQLAERFIIGEDSDPPRGRFNVSLASAFRAEDRVPIWVLTLTARIRSNEKTLSGALASLDEGRDWADRAFEQMTTSDMHNAWGLRRMEQNEFTR